MVAMMSFRGKFKAPSFEIKYAETWPGYSSVKNASITWFF